MSEPERFDFEDHYFDCVECAEDVRAPKPDPEPYLKLIGKYADAGFTHVYMHQIGDNQDEFAKFAAKELMPKL